MDTKKIVYAFLILSSLAVIMAIFVSARERKVDNNLPAINDLRKTIAIQNIKVEDKMAFDNKKVDLAITQKDVSYCDQMHMYARDNCIFDVASANNNPDWCAEIIDSKLKNKCQDLFVSRAAIKEKNVDKCGSVKDTDFRKQCYQEIFRKYDRIEQCQVQIGDAKEWCLDNVWHNLSYQRGDSKMCDNIKDADLKNDCQLVVSYKPKDSDGDGVSDTQERSYGTDPFNKNDVPK